MTFYLAIVIFINDLLDIINLILFVLVIILKQKLVDLSWYEASKNGAPSL